MISNVEKWSPVYFKNVDRFFIPIRAIDSSDWAGITIFSTSENIYWYYDIEHVYPSVSDSLIPEQKRQVLISIFIAKHKNDNNEALEILGY